MHTNDQDIKDLIRIAFPEFKGKRIKVEPFVGPMRIDSYWSGGLRDYFSAVNLITNSVAQAPENGTPFIPAFGPLEALPLNVALIRYTKGNFEYVTVYFNAENITKYLPPAIILTWAEKVVLAATRSLKSSYAGISNYRSHEASRETGIEVGQYETAKQSLIAKGLLNKAGAITIDGRNAAEKLKLRELKN